MEKLKDALASATGVSLQLDQVAKWLNSDSMTDIVEKEKRPFGNRVLIRVDKSSLASEQLKTELQGQNIFAYLRMPLSEGEIRQLDDIEDITVEFFEVPGRPDISCTQGSLSLLEQ